MFLIRAGGLEKNSKINKWGAGATFRRLRVKVQKKRCTEGKNKRKNVLGPIRNFQ